jgi:hypothetical protein
MLIDILSPGGFSRAVEAQVYTELSYYDEEFTM